MARNTTKIVEALLLLLFSLSQVKAACYVTAPENDRVYNVPHFKDNSVTSVPSAFQLEFIVSEDCNQSTDFKFLVSIDGGSSFLKWEEMKNEAIYNQISITWVDTDKYWDFKVDITSTATEFKFKLKEKNNNRKRYFFVKFIEYTLDATVFWDDASRVATGTTYGVSTLNDETMNIVQYATTAAVTNLVKTFLYCKPSNGANAGTYKRDTLISWLTFAADYSSITISKTGVDADSTAIANGPYTCFLKLRYSRPEYVTAMPQRTLLIHRLTTASTLGDFVFCQLSDTTSSLLAGATQQVVLPKLAGTTSSAYSFVMPSASPSVNCPLTHTYSIAETWLPIDKVAHTFRVD